MYDTTPGYAWDVHPKKNGIQLELLSDPDMLLMCENRIRWGIYTIPKNLSMLQNKHTEVKYNSDEPGNYETFLDANNLYD